MHAFVKETLSSGQREEKKGGLERGRCEAGAMLFVPTDQGGPPSDSRRTSLAFELGLQLSRKTGKYTAPAPRTAPHLQRRRE